MEWLYSYLRLKLKKKKKKKKKKKNVLVLLWITFLTFVINEGRRWIACLVDNIFVWVLAHRSVFHPSVMLSDNRISLAPTPKQMDTENFTLFPPSGVNFPFTKTDCPVNEYIFVYAENILEILCVDHTWWKVKFDNLTSFPIYFSGGTVY